MQKEKYTLSSKSGAQEPQVIEAYDMTHAVIIAEDLLPGDWEIEGWVTDADREEDFLCVEAEEKERCDIQCPYCASI